MTELAPSVSPLRVLIVGIGRGRYMIDRELGRGGMATVYLARDRSGDLAPRVAARATTKRVG